MPLAALLLPFLAAGAQVQADETIVVVGRAGPPFISPMGEPFREGAEARDTLADWFGKADGNADGLLTLDEMQRDAERFFVTLDSNGNRDIEPDELARYEWEIAREIQVNSRFRRSRGATGDAKPPKRRGAAYDPHALHGAARYSLLNIPEPVAAADADFDRSITPEEFGRAASYRFSLLDTARSGRLSLEQLRGMRPTGDKAKRRKGDRDTRIAVPVPLGD